MRLNYTDLNNCIEAMKTAVGSDKTGTSNIVLLCKPTDNKLQFVGISANYQVVRTIQPEFTEADTNLEILVNFKKFAELVSMSKNTSGIDTEIDIVFETDRKELVYTLTKLTAANNNYAEAKSQRQLLSKIKHRIEYTYVSQDKRNGGLDAISIDWLMTLENDSAENKDTCAWEINNFISTMTKMTSGDAGQIIMSNQTKVVATCNSNYAVYKEDSSAGMSLVFQSSILVKILNILKTLKVSKEEKLVILHKYDSRLAIFDEEHSFIIQTDVPLARKLMLNHINGFNSADYSHAGAVVRRDILLDTLKCFETLTGSAQTNMKIVLEGPDQYLRLEVPGSSSRQNDMLIKIGDMRGDTDVVNKTFGAAIGTLVQMLNTCDTKEVCLSIALPDVLNPDEVPAGTEENAAQALLKIATILENNTEGLKCYSVLG